MPKGHEQRLVKLHLDSALFFATMFSADPGDSFDHHRYVDEISMQQAQSAISNLQSAIAGGKR
jgi:hypothetical protein